MLFACGPDSPGNGLVVNRTAPILSRASNARPCVARLGRAVALSLVLIASPLPGQGPPATVVTLEGVVVDASTRARLPGVILMLFDENLATVSDSKGEFRLEDVPVGRRRLAVRQYGYLDGTIPVTVTSSPARLDIALTPDPTLVDQLAALAGRAVAVQGIVVDASSGARLRGASVLLASGNRGVLADSMGVFQLTGLSIGDHLLLVRQFGYESLYVPMRATTGQAAIEIPLEPDPLLLDGLSVEVLTRNLQTMEQRIRSRRNAAATSVFALGQDRLLRSGASDLLEFLEFEALLHPVGCSGSGFLSSRCIWRRGLLAEPKVFIDEIPAFGGLDQLATYRPQELHLIEVWSSGATIRAYTHQFMERMARRPVMLIW
jgi:hypothetical protein